MADGYDAVVVGAGPNGLVGAVTLAGAGLRVLVLEAADVAGGGTRSAALTLPGHVHDICSAVHPLALASPAMRALPLADHGVEWVHPGAPLAHPLDDGRAAVLERSVDATALGLGADGAAYLRLMSPLVAAGERLVAGLMSPLPMPSVRSLPALARFGLSGAWPADRLARHHFSTDEGQALIAGLAGHSMQSLGSPATGGFALFLGVLGHLVGWPVARGGSQSIADGLTSILVARGGEVELGRTVRSLADIPSAKVTLLDLSPRQILDLGGARWPARYRRRLGRFRYGPAAWKVDWALDGPIPWSAAGCARAGTVHLGGPMADIAFAESEVQRGRHPERPYVLLAQQSRFDDTRAPAGSENAWAYCHVPNGSRVDMTERIETQVERFAPGFRDRIVARHVMGPVDIEAHDANYVGGDIGSGATNLRQVLARPVLSPTPWRTPLAGVYLCSSSTPPGPGVHGMCGWHAARTALHDLGLGESARGHP
jgi:phytoene dehydrogenase-like protein